MHDVVEAHWPNTMTRQFKGAKSPASHRFHLSYPAFVVFAALIIVTNLNLSLTSEKSTMNSLASILDCPRTRAATTIAASKLRRYLEVTDGGIHACARFSTRYEASHLIQWLYYHKRIGISFFYLYVIGVLYSFRVHCMISIVDF